MMAIPNRLSVNLCVNCGILIRNTSLVKRHKASTISPVQQNLLQQWIERDVNGTDYICISCLESLDEGIRNEDVKRKVPHEEVCSGCGVSVKRKRHSKEKKDSPIGKAVLSWHPNTKNEDTLLICLACKAAISRSLNPRKTQSGVNMVQTNKIKLDVSEKDDGADVKRDVQEHNKLVNDINLYKSENLGEMEKSLNITDMFNGSPNNLNNLATDATVHPTQKRELLKLPNYRKLPGSSRYCVFHGCTRKERKLIPQYARMIVLTDFNILIPRGARVCSYHFDKGEWTKLNDNPTPRNLFSADDMQDALDILKKPNYDSMVNFEEVERMPNAFCQFATGLSSQEFLELHDSIQWTQSNSRRALAILLLKVSLGASTQKIAQFLGIGRTTVEREYNIATKCVAESDCVHDSDPFEDSDD